jgi:CRP-like cAMP-binding protein
MTPTLMPENPFLQGLTPEQYDLLAALFVPVEFPARGIIFQQGEDATNMYLLVRGGVSIRYKPYDGPRITLTRLHTGDVFGWSAIIGNAAYTADAIAASPARALRARGAEIRNLCSQYPTTGAQILEKLALAVAPRWTDSQAQVHRLLEQGMLDSRASPQSDAAA